MSNESQVLRRDEHRTSFAKVLSFKDLVVYGLVYIAPIAPWATFAYVYNLSGGAAVLSYLLGGVCMYFTANSYKEICIQVPSSGSVYAYARQAMGPGPGFVAGWLVLLDYLMLPALCYLLAAVALNTFIPSIPRWVWILMFAGFTLTVNWFGIVITARANMFFLWVQLVGVVGYMLWTIFALRGLHAKVLPPDAIWNHAVTPHGLFAATSICVLVYLGFDAITTLAEEVRPEQKHLLGKSIVVVLLIIVGITFLHTWVISAVARGFKFRDLASGAYDMTDAKVSPILGVIMAWLMGVISGIAITTPMLVGASRVLYAMAAGGQLPSILGKLHPKYRVPQYALLLTSVISLAVAVAFAAYPDELTGLVNFGALAAYAAVHLSVVVLFAIKRKSNRWISHVLMPIVGILIIAVVVTQMATKALVLGLGWFVVGIIYYALLRIFRRAAADVDTSLAANTEAS
jgi:amino acid transporter